MSTGRTRRSAAGREEVAVEDETVRRTGRWRGVSALALVAGAVGILAAVPGLVLCGVVGIAFAAVSRSARPPPVTLRIERSVSESRPAPDETVTVTVEVENVGEAICNDLRVVDGVPPGLGVAEGSPRFATAPLRPGETASFSYGIAATRGVHRFESAFVLLRDTVGATERVARVPAATDTPLTCVPPLGFGIEGSLRDQTIDQPGRVLTDVGGSGVAFQATREYRPGDPLSRVDWNRLAKTGDLSTVDLREERAAAVVLLVDAREEAYRASGPEAESAVSRSVRAAGALYVGLTNAENPTGIAALSPDPYWLAPGSGPTHRAQVREALATHPAFAPAPPDEPFFPSIRLRRLRRRLPARAQVVVCAPVCDDALVRLLRRLDVGGHRVSVVSPDPTATDTPGSQLARTERRVRLSKLRAAGIPVIDWGDEPLAVALARAGGSR
ncbi:DUF58 domain-containing protein [Halococcus salsus]|uniref:DUF58 domain-containing protein n=1 Tax=Halococcus salsus TaxID=2162894 RepID=UPI00135746E3|nr:DUF58 domain-containing protein [Halococcus salsus]